MMGVSRLTVTIPDSPLYSDLDRKMLEGQVVRVTWDSGSADMKVVRTSFPGDDSLVVELEGLCGRIGQIATGR